jgi:solute carrier family 12 (potassium/chloride transporter), member 4/6
MSSIAAIRKKYFKDKSSSSNIEDSQKFGMFTGVFVPCLLMLFGVIIFLRLGWMVGQVGLATSLFIITMAAFIAFISTLSMASISTNLQVGKGGVYYIISRSLGIEVGSAVGIPLYVKQVLSIAFCCVGFAESLHDLIPSFSITNIGIGTLIVLTFLAYTSVKGALKVQVTIFAILILSFISLFTGQHIQPVEPGVITQSFTKLGFWAIFAIFFPAMTGVESIVSLSGDLKNPSKAIPIGTILASIVSYLTYISIAIFLAYHVPIQRLASDPFIVQSVASIPSLIVLGIWGATLSSALGGLLSAPRTLQAISDDGILPKFLGKTYGKTNEPRVATVLTFLIAFIAIFLGSINIIAPMMTMICLVSYGVLNFSSGFETLMSNPSWRPRFRIPWIISFIGALLCLLTMLMIDAGVALISLLGVVIIYFAVKKKKSHGSWADIRQGILMFISRYTIYELSHGPSFSKSWRPHFLVFTKSSEEYSHNLLSFTDAISQSKSFLTMASFVSDNNINAEKKNKLSDIIAKRLKNKNIEAFVNITEGEQIPLEMRHMLKYYGLGPLKPNTVIFGGIKTGNKINEFAKTIECALNRCYNVVIVNDEIEAGSDFSHQSNNNDIHVWWDDNNQECSELMLVFAYMMQRNPNRKKCHICLKIIIKDERAKQGRIKYFQDLSLKLRLPLNIEAYVSQDPQNVKFQFMKTFSKEADIVLMSLKKPHENNESEESYESYLEKISKITKENPNIVLVLGSEHTPLDSILH